jgi:hypothetical protein
LRAVQGFNNLVNYSPVILTVVQIISAALAQTQQQLVYSDLGYDAQYNGVKINTNSTFTRYDTNNTLVKIGGLWPLGPQTNISFTALATAANAFILTLTFSAVDSIRNFRMVS